MGKDTKITRLIELDKERTQGSDRNMDEVHRLQEREMQSESGERSQRVTMLKSKSKWYDAKCKDFEQKRLFQWNRRYLSEEIDGGQHQELIPEVDKEMHLGKSFGTGLFY